MTAPPSLVLIAGLVLAGLLVLGYLVFAGSRDKRRYEDVPPGMRPAYSDEQLEKGVIERYMGWGLVLVAFFAIFFPIYWLQETSRIQEAEGGLFTSSVAEGETLFADNCAQCHGSEARGGAAPHPYQDDGTWPAPNLRTIVSRYEENPEVDDVRQLLRTTIERGRPGTPMPVFGQGFQGPLTDEQIEAITNWLLVNQEEPEADGEDGDGDGGEDGEEAAAETTSAVSGEELFAENCARCHGPEAGGQVGPTLIGVLERHGRQGVEGIVSNGIRVGTGTSMPPFQNGWFYPRGPLSDEELDALIDYLAELQPEELPEGADEWQTPGVRPFDEGSGDGDSGDGGSGDGGDDDDEEVTTAEARS